MFLYYTALLIHGGLRICRDTAWYCSLSGFFRLSGLKVTIYRICYGQPSEGFQNIEQKIVREEYQVFCFCICFTGNRNTKRKERERVAIYALQVLKF
jgi:hypothetical protein